MILDEKQENIILNDDKYPIIMSYINGNYIVNAFLPLSKNMITGKGISLLKAVENLKDNYRKEING